MTNQQTTEPTTGSTTEPNAATALVEVDPRSINIGTNVRLDARLDRAFIASIRDRGVLLPIRAYRDADGAIVAVDGQRRTLAAAELGLSTIPAYVSPTPEDADRIIDQLAANDHRAGLTAGEHAAAFEQLSAFGLSAAQIAKRTGHKRAQVDAGLAASASEPAREALSAHTALTLDQAAGLAQVEDDPAAVKRLLDALPQGQFDHTLQRILDERAEAQARALLIDALTAQQVTVIDRPEYDDRKPAQLSHLKGTDKGGMGTEEHAACEGHAAYIVRAYGDDLVEPVYVCTDWRKHGHQDRYGSSSTKKPAAEMTETEREAAKAERRDVIESNKAWRSAEVVRREWVTKFLTRKTAPKGAAAFIATAMFYDSYGLNQVDRSIVESFIGHRGGYADDGAQAAADKATEGRATVLALGYALAAAESATGTHSWREVSKHTARYLTFLADQGYTLSPVEERAAGVKPAKRSKKQQDSQ
ncbi:ParB/RepB/Spo0J family partition protein [Calidifontibacter indicus]|uniref:ParB family chromosome partitioning protein n=1 Tax=Calidifontibacter indicus TaxID=419650 RepID=A0A3D9U610_9MICO|nr:ParB N-terminal domain-containing protein [Calidifontibacter indicus]REF24636.1 ParB family chromosome partitioning protein [Calidifontibacter indicus]